MMALLGLLGAAILFALLGYSATRAGSRIESGEGCHGDSCSLDSCSLHEHCEAGGEEKKLSGWWPDDGVTYGDRR